MNKLNHLSNELKKLGIVDIKFVINPNTELNKENLTNSISKFISVYLTTL